MNKYKAIVLAGGQGKRMKSELPKVLHKVFDKTIIDCVLDACTGAGISDICVVVGVKSEQVKENIESNVKFAFQKEQLGTGHAVLCAKDFIEDDDNVMVINGDMPLISSTSIKGMFEFNEKNNYAACVMSGNLDNPTGYGRIIRYNDGLFAKIVEQKDASEEQQQIKEGNLGVYCFKGNYLKTALEKLDNNNAQGEYYITDALYHILSSGGKVGVYVLDDISEGVNVNSRLQLAQTTEIYLKRVCDKHLANGVTLIHPTDTCIGEDVMIGSDTIVYSGTMLEGKTTIGKNCIIGPNVRIINSHIGDNVTIENSKIVNSNITNDSIVGPYANLYENMKIYK